MLDQLLSAASNVLLTIIVARSVSVELFGAYSVVMIVYTIVLGVTRAVLGEPLLTGAAASQEVSPWTAGVQGVVLGLGSGLLVAAGALIAPALREPLLLLALLLPTLIAQDAVRYWAFAVDRTSLVVALDSVWLGLVVLSFLAATISAWRPTVSSAIVVWGSASFVSLAAGAATLRTSGDLFAAASPGASLRLTWGLRRLGRSYLVQFLSTYAASAASFALAPAVMGLGEAGELRAAFFAYSAVNVLVAAATTVGVTLLVRHSSTASMGPIVLAESAFLAAVVLANMAVLIALPTEVGELALGDSFVGAQRFAVPVGLAIVVSVVGLGPLAGLRASEAARGLTRARLWFALTVPVFSLGGSVLDGRTASGFAYGWLAASTIGTVALWVTWTQSRRVPARAA